MTALSVQEAFADIDVTPEEERLAESSGPLVVFVRQGAFPIPRVIRNLRICEDLGWRTLFIGAHRERGLAQQETWDGVQIRRVGRLYALAGGKGILRYGWGLATFLLCANWLIWRLRPTIIHASDIEGFLACCLVKLLRPRTRIIFNIHDNLAQRYAVPDWVKACFRAFEGIAARCCSVTLLPDRGRLECMGAWRPPHYLLIPNTPEDPGFSPLDPSTVPPLKLCLVGWLEWCRGVDVAEKLLAEIPEVELVVAGNGPVDVEEHIRTLPRTRYLGFLPHRNVLEVMRDCHVVLALYDPCKEINRYASPNKVGDALAVGRPLLINKEVALSSELAEYNCALVTPYHDVSQMASELRKLLANPEDIARLGQAAREAYDRAFHWDRFRVQVCSLFQSLAAANPEKLPAAAPSARKGLPC